MAYEINYEDERFQNVETAKQEQLTKNEQMYDGMISQSDQFYQDKVNAVKDYAQTQADFQQEQTDFTIEQIEQQKADANKSYQKEQSGAYTDWQKQSNQYGANAEQMAASGLTNTGYSESSQVSMYNTYQNRVATARESYQKAVLDYDNAITQARLQNSSALAEIAFNALMQQLDLSLQGFQYKNQLLLDQANRELQIEDMYYGRWQNVLNQINTENALAEQVRQHNESLAEERRQYDQNYQLSLQQLAEDQRQFDANMAEEQRQYNQNYAFSQQQFAEEKRQNDRNYALAQQKAANTEKTASAQLSKYNNSAGSLNEAVTKTLNAAGTISNTMAKALNASSKVSKAVSSSGGGGTFGTSDKSTVKGNWVETPYYRGELNVDVAEFGAFKNGYQPKGISGHGKVDKTGDFITFETITLSGEVRTVRQNIWEAVDGTKWRWDGVGNQYVPYYGVTDVPIVNGAAVSIG